MTQSVTRNLGRILVTGAQGFLGSALIARLQQHGNDVAATDLSSASLPCDLTNAAKVDAVIQHGYDTIFHCGAVSGPMVLADRPLAIWQINALGTAHVLEAARRHGTGRVVICSTSEVYGPTLRAVDETTLPDPRSVYAASKLAAEHATRGYTLEHGLDAVTLRLSWIYGPGRLTPTNLERVLRAGVAGHPASLDAQAQDMTHYLHIDDAVTGLILAAHATTLSQRLFNITAGPGIPTQSVATLLQRLNPRARIDLRPHLNSATGPTLIDNSAAARHLGFHPAMTLDTGLQAYLHALQSP